MEDSEELDEEMESGGSSWARVQSAQERSGPCGTRARRKLVLGSAQEVPDPALEESFQQARP